MLKLLHDERVAEDKRVEDAQRAKLAALQHELTARAMEGAKQKKKRYGATTHSDEMARRRLEVSLDMELEQRKLAWEEKKREGRIMTGLVKPQLRGATGGDEGSSPLLAAAATTVPHSPMRLRTNLSLPKSINTSSPRRHSNQQHQEGDGDGLSPTTSHNHHHHHHQPSPPINPQSSSGSFNTTISSNSASPGGRNYHTGSSTRASAPSAFTLQSSVHQQRNSAAAVAASTARLPLPPGLEGMSSQTSFSSPGRGTATSSRRPAGGSLRGKAAIAVSNYVPPPTLNVSSSSLASSSPRLVPSSKSASSPHGGLTSLGVRLPHRAAI